MLFGGLWKKPASIPRAISEQQLIPTVLRPRRNRFAMFLLHRYVEQNPLHLIQQFKTYNFINFTTISPEGI